MSWRIFLAIALSACGASSPAQGTRPAVEAEVAPSGPAETPAEVPAETAAPEETPAETPEETPAEAPEETRADRASSRSSSIIACAGDAECGWDDPCVPTRCVAAATSTDAAACDETAPPPGTCECLGGRCTLRPNAPGPAASCTSFCAVDPTRGVCAPAESGVGVLPDGIARAGATCTCDGPRGGATCTYRIHERVPCRSALDCDVGLENGALFPTRARPRRRREFRPCEDGEWAPTCVEGECRLVGFGC